MHILGRCDEGLLECNGAGAVGIFRDGHLDGIFGKKVFDELGPLNETEGTTVEIILIAHVIDFLQALDAVEVEVEDALIMSFVLVDNGEGGTGDDILNTQFLTDSFDEGGLSAPILP